MSILLEHTHIQSTFILLASVLSWFWISIRKLRNTIPQINKHMQSLLAGWWMPVEKPSSDDASSSFHASNWNSIKQKCKEIRSQFWYMLATNSVYFLCRMAAFHAKTKHQISQSQIFKHCISNNQLSITSNTSKLVELAAHI